MRQLKMPDYLAVLEHQLVQAQWHQFYRLEEAGIGLHWHKKPGYPRVPCKVIRKRQAELRLTYKRNKIGYRQIRTEDDSELEQLVL